jgi:small subunit ribosomal protein S6
MPLYELGLVLSVDLSEEDRTTFLAELKALVESEGGSIVKEDVWGKRNLAYEINHQREGYYLFWQIESPGTLVKPLEYRLRLSDQVLRYLMLNLDREMQRARKMERIKAAKKAAKKVATSEVAEPTATEGA